MNKSVYIDTLGCAKNEYDSELLLASLIEKGFEMIDSPEDADILIVNTCGFIEDAKIESINHILEMGKIKGEDKKLIVCGCLSKRYHDELLKEIPEVDLFAGVNEYDKLPDIITKLTFEQSLEFDEIDIVSDEPSTSLEYNKRNLETGVHSAFLKVAEGCNNTCAFCAIPAIRGPYRSKKLENVIREAHDLASKGVKEIILIAQDLSVYGRDLYGEIKLVSLIKELCKVDGIRWIRLMYMYDDNITRELIETIKSEPKICNYLDIPIQHISDNILKSMNRKSSSKSIKNTIDMIREIIPDMCIRTTLLVGFPGETLEDFSELMDFIKENKLDRVGVFKYSDEDGTEAFKLDNKIDDDIKDQRLASIMNEQMKISLKKNKEKIGQIMEVIIDEIDGGSIAESIESSEPIFTYIGRSRSDAPEVDCEITITSGREHRIGDIIKVIIEDAMEYDLIGSEVED